MLCLLETHFCPCYHDWARCSMWRKDGERESLSLNCWHDVVVKISPSSVFKMVCPVTMSCQRIFVPSVVSIAQFLFQALCRIPPGLMRVGCSGWFLNAVTAAGTGTLLLSCQALPRAGWISHLDRLDHRALVLCSRHVGLCCWLMQKMGGLTWNRPAAKFCVCGDYGFCVLTLRCSCDVVFSKSWKIVENYFTDLLQQCSRCWSVVQWEMNKVGLVTCRRQIKISKKVGS